MTVPPEPGSDFSPTVDDADRGGYYTDEWLVSELMCWLGLSKPDAEAYLDRHGAADAIEAVSSQLRR